MKYRHKATGELVEALVWEGDNGTAVRNLIGAPTLGIDGRVQVVDFDGVTKLVAPGRFIAKESDGIHVYNSGVFVEQFEEEEV